MTYRELIYKATRLIDKGEITLDEYEEMTKPLDRKIGNCQDCKHSYLNTNGSYYCSNRLNVDSVTDRYREPDWYCADFERKK